MMKFPQLHIAAVGRQSCLLNAFFYDFIVKLLRIVINPDRATEVECINKTFMFFHSAKLSKSPLTPKGGIKGIMIKKVIRFTISFNYSIIDCKLSVPPSGVRGLDNGRLPQINIVFVVERIFVIQNKIADKIPDTGGRKMVCGV